MRFVECHDTEARKVTFMVELSYDADVARLPLDIAWPEQGEAVSKKQLKVLEMVMRLERNNLESTHRRCGRMESVSNKIEELVAACARGRARQ